MKTTLEQLEINGEVLDITEYATKEEMQSVAKESTLLQESAAIKDKIDNIDLSSIEEKIDNIKLPEIDTTELAKQGENPEATNSKILEEVGKIPNIARLYTAYAVKNDDGENTYSIVLPVSSDAIDNGDETVTLKLQ